MMRLGCVSTRLPGRLPMAFGPHLGLFPVVLRLSFRLAAAFARLVLP